ncbi:PAS domain-containing protein [Frankia sp. R43]|uniref:sensor histidine kinase n=1 Tax=Frankia sp. R43 TaxID=269536 RepID=UPI00350FA347
MTSVPRRTVRTPEEEPAGVHGRDTQLLLDTLGEVVFETDAEGRWTYLNKAWEKLTGFEIDASLGTRFLDYVHPDELDHTVTLFMGVVAGGADHCHHETRYRTRDGNYRRVQIRAMVHRDHTGAVIGNTGTILDVTASRHGTETIGEHAALLNLVSAQVAGGDLPVGVAIYGADRRLKRASPVLDHITRTPQRLGAPLSHLTDRLQPVDPQRRAFGGDWGLVATATRTNHAQTADIDVTLGIPDSRDPDVTVTSATHSARTPVLSLRASVIPYLQDGEDMLALVLADITDLRRAERRQTGLARLSDLAMSGAEIDHLIANATSLIASTLDATDCDVIRIEAPGSRAPVANTPPACVRHLLEEDSTALTAWIGSPTSDFSLLSVHPPKTHSFTTDDQTFVRSIAHLLTAAIDRKHAERELRQLYEQAERGKEWLAASAQMTARVLTAPDQSSALNAITSTARQMAAADLGAVAVPDEHGTLVLTAVDVATSLHVTSETLRGLTVRFTTASAHDDLTHGRRLIVDQLDLRGSRVTPAPDLPFSTALIVPMRIASQPPTMLILAHLAAPPSHDCTARESDHVQAFANDAALALELAHAQQEQGRLAVFQERDRIARDLHDQVIQRLFAIGLQLHSTSRIVSDVATARLTAATNALDQTIDDIRHTIFHLNPTK